MTAHAFGIVLAISKGTKVIKRMTLAREGENDERRANQMTTLRIVWRNPTPPAKREPLNSKHTLVVINGARIDNTPWRVKHDEKAS